MDSKQILSRNLKKLIENAGITQVELSEWSGINPNTINQYYNAHSLPNLDKACKIARVFRIHAEDLLKE